MFCRYLCAGAQLPRGSSSPRLIIKSLLRSSYFTWGGRYTILIPLSYSCVYKFFLLNIKRCYSLSFVTLICSTSKDSGSIRAGACRRGPCPHRSPMSREGALLLAPGLLCVGDVQIFVQGFSPHSAVLGDTALLL